VKVASSIALLEHAPKGTGAHPAGLNVSPGALNNKMNIKDEVIK